MSSLYKRSNGVYYVAFFDKARTPRRLYVTTRTTVKREAEKVKVRLDNGVLHGRYDPWRDDPRTFDAPEARTPEEAVRALRTTGEAARAFLESRSNLTASTRERYRSIVERFAAHVGPATPVRTLTTAHVQSFINSTETKPVTRMNYRRALSTAFSWLRERGDVRADPTADVRLERVPQKHPRFLSPCEVDRLCEAVEARHLKAHVEEGTGLWLLPIVRANVYLGLRAGEVVNVRWGDVDLVRGTLTVRNTETFTTKAGKERALPLCAAVLDVLRGLERRGEFVFPNHTGGQLHRQYLSRQFKHFIRLAELPAHVNFHTTRHTAGSWLAQQGAGVEAIRLYLGHSSIAVTQRYMHLSPDAFSDQIGAAFSRVHQDVEKT